METCPECRAEFNYSTSYRIGSRTYDIQRCLSCGYQKHKETI